MKRVVGTRVLLLPFALFCLCLSPITQGRIVFDPSEYSSVQGEDGWFTVTWSGIPEPLGGRDENDMVALYLTKGDSPVDMNATVPISFVYPYLLDKEAWKNGGGSFKFYLANYRSNVRAVYLRPPNWVPLVASEGQLMGEILDSSEPLVMTQDALDTPSNRVLAYTNEVGSMRVTWQVGSMNQDLPRSMPLIRYGLSKNSLNMTAKAYSSTYRASNMCLPPSSSYGYHDPGTFNSGIMRDLKPNTRYFYSVGDEATGVFSSIESFMSPASPDDVLKMIVIADNYAYNEDGSRYFTGAYAIEGLYGPYPQPVPGMNLTLATSYITWMEDAATNSASFVSKQIKNMVLNGTEYHGIAVNGDLSYSYGFLYRWVTWLNNHKVTFSNLPTLTSPGNHEADDPSLPFDAFEGKAFDSTGECAIPYIYMMRPPIEKPIKTRKMWYSTNNGPVHFIQLSTEQEIGPGSVQYEFLKNDLEQVDRSQFPWVIVGWHRPMYTDQPSFTPFIGSNIVSQRLRDEVEPLFAEYQVDVVFSGHIHKYTRSCPVLKGTCVGYSADDGTARGPVHLMTGNAGAPGVYYAYLEDPSWRDFQSFRYGFGELTVSRTNLTFKMITADDSGEFGLADSIVLKKPLGWKPNRVSAQALYRNTPVTPDPAINSTFGFWKPETLFAVTHQLVQENAELAEACFGSDTFPYAFANDPYIQTFIPSQSWEVQTALMTFWNSTLIPSLHLPNMSKEAVDSLVYSLDYSLKSYRREAVGSTLPPGCQ